MGVVLTSAPEPAHGTAPAVVGPRTPPSSAAQHPSRGRVRRPDATGPLTLVPRPRRSPVARAVRALAFPAVVLAALALGGWETHRIVLAQQPSTSVIASPTVDASWGRLVVLRTTSRPLATSSGRAVDVVVRVVGSGAGAFDPAEVRLRAADGAAVPVTFGATRPARLVAGHAVEGQLGFALPAGDGPLTLVVLDGGAEHLVPLRPGPVGAGELSPPATWRPAG